MRRPTHLVSFFSPGTLVLTLVGDVILALRHPVLFFRLALGAPPNGKRLVRLLRLSFDLETIRASPLFAGKWYRENHPEFAKSPLSPELHYLLFAKPGNLRASPAFSGDDYFALNPELEATGIHPLVHYEQYGRFTGLPVSRLEADSPGLPFPADAKERSGTFPLSEPHHRRTAVFAAFFRDGRIPETALMYLRALKEVADNVILIGNCPILPGEEEKLRSLVAGFVFRAHGGYDFGSYRIGLSFARESGLLDAERCNELVFANDSCLAPLYPFAEMFGKMDRRNCDFWGVTENRQFSGRPHLQSYFLVFRRPVLDSKALEQFFAARPERSTRSDTIRLFEIQLSDELRNRGFVSSAFVRPHLPRLHRFNPTTRPLDLIRRFRVPLVKTKALRGESSQKPERIAALIRRLNPELGALIDRTPGFPSIRRRQKSSSPLSSSEASA